MKTNLKSLGALLRESSILSLGTIIFLISERASEIG